MKTTVELPDDLLRRAPENDVWIAALALQHRLPVVSRDRHFDRVEGLERRSW
jgi:predicted nucleic acid-binding protein